ncbi:hypothetical protein RHSIM_Rhsim11G0038600 [Rhododendron simsii]|uniref:Uncharacterized protein n=1 Tax=Rhododendron simsii TaxID=118357 RepID=A0A834LA84_RHOSS|nr:hypothetical protein RHSIM_Rhsim11G0038600 [Rhododendron simsii]
MLQRKQIKGKASSDKMYAPGTSRIRARHSRRNHKQGPQLNITRDVTGSPAQVKEGSGIVTRHKCMPWDIKNQSSAFAKKSSAGTTSEHHQRCDWKPCTELINCSVLCKKEAKVSAACNPRLVLCV